jgi:hypothetical protein
MSTLLPFIANMRRILSLTDHLEMFEGGSAAGTSRLVRPYVHERVQFYRLLSVHQIQKTNSYIAVSWKAPSCNKNVYTLKCPIWPEHIVYIYNKEKTSGQYSKLYVEKRNVLKSPIFENNKQDLAPLLSATSVVMFLGNEVCPFRMYSGKP